MTNKTLSEQICEVCGIAYTITEDNCRVYDNDGELCEQYVYKLDFEQPTNFMKLLEIIHDRMSIEGLLMYEIDEDSLTRRFLKLVIKFLNGELGYVETKIDAVKQAIREADWEY